MVYWILAQTKLIPNQELDIMSLSTALKINKTAFNQSLQSNLF